MLKGHAIPDEIPGEENQFAGIAVGGNLRVFEQFWCDIIGFRKTWENNLSAKMI